MNESERKWTATIESKVMALEATVFELSEARRFSAGQIENIKDKLDRHERSVSVIEGFLSQEKKYDEKAEMEATIQRYKRMKELLKEVGEMVKNG